MKKTLFLEVSRDKYELPLAVADSQAELSRMIGVDVTSISHARKRAKLLGAKSKYVTVEVDI